MMNYNAIAKELYNMVERADYSKMTLDERYSYYRVHAGRYFDIKYIYNEENANKIFERACELLADSDEIIHLRHSNEMFPLKSFFAKLEKKA